MSVKKATPEWRKLEQLMQRLFKKVPGAKVVPDARIEGESGVTRKFELWVTYPFTIPISENFRVPLRIKIAVDCKRHTRPVYIAAVGAFVDQMDDVGAHAGILVATGGVSEGARKRAAKKSLFIVHAPSDLLMLTKGLLPEEFFVCECCDGSDSDGDPIRGFVQWNYGELTDYKPVIGDCDKCNAPHAMCPDCAETIGFQEVEYGRWIECLGECGRVFRVSRDHDDLNSTTVHTIGPIERQVLLDAAAHEGRLARTEYRDSIAGTKWQYATGKADPLKRLLKRGWIRGNEKGKPIRLSTEGLRVANSELNKVRHSQYGW